MKLYIDQSSVSYNLLAVRPAAHHNMTPYKHTASHYLVIRGVWLEKMCVFVMIWFIAGNSSPDNTNIIIILSNIFWNAGSDYPAGHLVGNEHHNSCCSTDTRYLNNLTLYRPWLILNMYYMPFLNFGKKNVFWGVFLHTAGRKSGVFYR